MSQEKPELKVPNEETYKAIKDRFPGSDVEKYLINTKNPNIDTVRQELKKIILGTDSSKKYLSRDDKDEAKKWLGWLDSETYYKKD